LAAEHSGPLLTRKGQIALNIFRNGTGAVQEDALHEIVASNASYLITPMITMLRESGNPRAPQAIETHGVTGLKRLLKEKTSLIGSTAIAQLAQLAATHVLQEEKKLLDERLEGRVMSYFKQRGITIKGTNDKIDLASAIRAHLRELEGDLNLSERLDVRAIERHYIIQRKASRTSKLDEATQVNVYHKRICQGANFTHNQKAMIKRFVRNELFGLNKRKLAVLGEMLEKKIGFLDISVRHSEIENDFIDSNRAHFLQQFKPAEKVFVKPKPTGHVAPTKLGTHETRVANHIARERTSKQKTRDLNTFKAASKESGVVFDPQAYCLSEIEKENPKSGKTIRDMVEKGLLKSGVLSSLFVSGSETIKTFINIAQNPKFSQLFGDSYISVLAKVVSFIGPGGKPINRTKKAFQSPQSKQVYEFLDRNGFLKIHYGGRPVVSVSTTNGTATAGVSIRTS
jgi:hypothetical protein